MSFGSLFKNTIPANDNDFSESARRCLGVRKSFPFLVGYLWCPPTVGIFFWFSYTAIIDLYMYRDGRVNMPSKLNFLLHDSPGGKPVIIRTALF